MFRVFSTFTGIGGFEIGIQNASVGRLNTELVGYSEIDKYAVQVFDKHFKGVKNYGDITKIKAEELPDFDCIVGGFPCQAFSHAGRRAGFNDTRGTLFFDLARILRAKQPRLFVFENVKGLLSHDGGKTFRVIIATIEELGYDCQWQVLNSKSFGVPQNRERIIIVGHLRGQPRPQVFPFRSDSPEDTAGSEDQVTGTIDTSIGKNHRQSGATYIVHNIYGGFKETSPRIFKNESPTIRTSRGGGHLPSVIVGKKVRRLTPLECERLQAFPDNWTAEGTAGPISDTQRYKMAGNAVTTTVIQAVFERIFTSELTNGRGL